MDKKQIEERLNALLKLRESHEQDIKELSYVIEGLKKSLK